MEKICVVVHAFQTFKFSVHGLRKAVIQYEFTDLNLLYSVMYNIHFFPFNYLNDHGRECVIHRCVLCTCSIIVIGFLWGNFRTNCTL